MTTKKMVAVKSSFHKKLKSIAKKKGLTLFEVVDEALKDYLG